MSFDIIAEALPHPLLLLNFDNQILAVNSACESFFLTSRNLLTRQKIQDLIPFSSPALALIEHVKRLGGVVNEYRVDLSTPRIGTDKSVDIFAHLLENNTILLMLQERQMAEKMDRQLTSITSARSVTGLASMLAHEIKNPLSGIKGAAQLLEMNADENDRMLTRLIVEETDRIVKLVDRMEVFSDDRPLKLERLNIHAVLEHCKVLSTSGFARHIHIEEQYDPSLPLILGHKDQLIQVFINLLKNASEAIGTVEHGQIKISTAYRPGVRLQIATHKKRLKLPLEVIIRDNGPGISPDVLSNLFDPFITTKTNGSGLGLALVAKIIRDHGGIIECESSPQKTQFRILLPLAEETE